MVIKIAVNCKNCNEEVILEKVFATFENPVINVSMFENTEWYCDCGHVTCIADIDSWGLEST